MSAAPSDQSSAAPETNNTDAQDEETLQRQLQEQERTLHAENDGMIWSNVIDKVSELGDGVLSMRCVQNPVEGMRDQREILAINQSRLAQPLPVDHLGRSQYADNSQVAAAERALLDVYAIQTEKEVSRADLAWD